MRTTDNYSSIPVSTTLLLSRLVVAFIFLWHGLPKALSPGLAAQKFVEFGLPGWIGPVTGTVEVAAALLLTIGLFHLAAAVTLAAVIVGALITVQIPGGFTAGLERDFLILAATLTLAALGPGRFSLESLPNARALASDAGAAMPHEESAPANIRSTA